MKAILSVLIFLATSPATASTQTKWVAAISQCHLDETRALADAGFDVNALDAKGEPLLRWFASGQHCSDDAGLELAAFLETHGARFTHAAPAHGPELVVNLAPRHRPKTLGFLAQRSTPAVVNNALRAVAKSDDVESVRALLASGADPLDGEEPFYALLAAVQAGRSETVAEMLGKIPDKQSPRVVVALMVAQRRGGTLMDAFLRAGIQPLPPPPVVKSPCQPQALSSEEARALTSAGVAAGAQTACKTLQPCGDLVLIDCNSAADGPAYYLDVKRAKILATCGGACMRGCPQCPPPEWTCSCTR